MSKIMVLGVVVFLAVVAALPTLKDDGYSAMKDSISEGALGRLGLLQTAAFIILGIASLALVKLVSDGLRGRRAATAAALLVVWSVGVLICGVFEVDAGAKGETAAAKVHLVAALAAFVAALVAVWLTTFAVRGEPGLAGVFPWSLGLAVVITVAFLAAGSAPQDSSWDGLAQRVFITVLLVWMAALAVAVDRAVRRPAHSQRPT